MAPSSQARSPRRRRLRVAAVVLGVALILVVAVLELQRLVLFPRFAVRADPRAGATIAGLERSWITTEQGSVETWWLPGDGVSAEHPGPAVVFAHGNAELVDHWPELLAPYRRLGVSVLLPEYRGYGRSAGDPSERAIVDDFVAAFDALVTRSDVDAKRVVFHGRSLGGGVVCGLARRRAPRALVLESTFTSIVDMARGWLLPRALVLDPFESADAVAKLDVPVLVGHGSHDRVVPTAHGRALAARAPNGRFVSYDSDHNDFPPDRRTWFAEIERTLREAGVLPTP